MNTTDIILIALASIALAVATTNLYLLRILARKQTRLREHMALYHRIVATVAPIIGLARLMQDGDDFTTEQRARISAAFEEQVATFHRTLGIDRPMMPETRIVVRPEVAS